MKKGLFIVVSGPAGSGKGTVVKQLREKLPSIGISVSATTRGPRPGEENGVHYYFIPKEEFVRRIERGEILEYTNYCDNYYGTLKCEAERIVGEGKDLILEIEVDGASQIKKLYPDAVCVMLLPPSAKILEARLRGRGTESDEVICCRMKRAREELSCLHSYDYIIINNDDAPDECAESLISIIKAEHARVARMSDFADNFFSEHK